MAYASIVNYLINFPWLVLINYIIKYNKISLIMVGKGFGV